MERLSAADAALNKKIEAVMATFPSATVLSKPIEGKVSKALGGDATSERRVRIVREEGNDVYYAYEIDLRSALLQMKGDRDNAIAWLSGHKLIKGDSIDAIRKE